MGAIRADVEGLSALGASCQEQVALLVSVGPAPPAVNSFQASAAVIAATHTEVMATGTKITACMQSMADDITIAAHEYALAEANSASAVAVLRTTVL